MVQTTTDIRRGAITLLVAFVATVGVGSNSALAVGGDDGGQVVFWGAYAPAPPSIVPYSQLAAGRFNTVGVRVDGSVGAWGANDLDQCSVPAAAYGVRQVASGWNHTVSLRGDGAVICWGSNKFDWSGGWAGQSVVPSDLPVAKSVGAGAFHTLAVLNDDTVRCWGYLSATTNAPPAGLVDVRSCDAGDKHNVALRSNGSLSCWGANTYGQLNVPIDLPSCAMIACGGTHSAALTVDGTVRCWGSNGDGQCDTPAGLISVTAIAAGWSSTFDSDRGHTVALKSDGSVVSWGTELWGLLTPPPTIGPCRQICAGNESTRVIDLNGDIRGWGKSLLGELPENETVGIVKSIDGGGVHCLTLRSTGAVSAIGSNASGQTDIPAVPQRTPISAVSAGGAHSLALSSTGEVFAWGANTDLQCEVPTDLGPFVAIAAGGAHSIGVRANQLGVVCWGADTYGQCVPPVALTTAPIYIWDVDGGGEHSIAIASTTANGARSVYCWGSDEYGQRTVPNSITDPIAVAAGGFHNLALSASGGVTRWGRNHGGSTGGIIPGSFVDIAAGYFHSLCLGADGRVVAYGSNTSGESDVPADLGHVTAIGAMGSTSVAIVEGAYSQCGGVGGAGQTATLAMNGCQWDSINIWEWTGGVGLCVPGPGSTVDLGSYGSVGSACDAACETLHTRGGTTVLVPVDLTLPSAGQSDHSIDVAGTANLAGRVMLVGRGAATLPLDLNIPVLRTGNPVAGFDIVQTTVPAPAGYFLALVPSAGVQGSTLYSLRLLPLESSAGLVGSSTGSFSGEAVAAEAMDWNGDGFDDLALAIDFGASQNGQLQVMLNDGTGNLGLTSLLVATPPVPTCLAVGDLNGDGKSDAVVGTASDQRVHLYYNNAPTMAPAFTAGPVINPNGMPLSVVVMQPPPSLQGMGGDVGVGSNGGTSGETQVAGYSGTTGAGSGDPVVVSTTPTTTTRRGGRLATGGSSSSSVDGVMPVSAGRVSIIEWRQVGTPAVWRLTEVQVMDVPGSPVAIEMADIDGDGLDEIVTANADPVFQGAATTLPVLTMFRGTTTSFGSAIPIAPEGASVGRDISLIDIDNDGDRDLVSVQQTLGSQTTASTIRIDTAGPGGAMTIGDQSAIDAQHPTLCTRGNLDGVGGEDLFLVDDGGASLVGGLGVVRPYRLDTGDAAWATPADINGDGTVNGGDLGMVLASWGACVEENCPSDINGDRVVNATDLAMLLATWGTSRPVINSVTPLEGLVQGGTLLTISGSNLETTTAVKVGDSSCANLQVISPTLITAITPPGSGTAAITLESPFGITAAPIAFSYHSPSITSVTPNRGPPGGGTAITITGTYLSGATSVKIGGIAASNVTSIGANTVTAVTPAGTVGSKTVEVTTPIGTVSASGAFIYETAIVPSWATLIDATPNPLVVTNASMRAAIIATGLAWRVRDTATGIEMLLVPPGTFSMGCSPSLTYGCSANENPVHQVTLTKPFYVGRYEVTQSQWTATMGSNPSQFQGASYPDAANRPVEKVTWAQVQSFLLATGMGLPTESQWEFACRAGTTTAFHSCIWFPSGTNEDTLAQQIAWHSGNAGLQTHVVGGKAANALGIHDMSGNVLEWVSDWWFSPYGSAALIDPTGPVVGTDRVTRGGSFANTTNYSRSSYRNITPPTTSTAYIGFRVVRCAPVISSVYPLQGSTLGGKLITISGSNLAGTTAVKVGGVACTNLQVLSPSSVTALTPAAAPGEAAITLVSQNGTATAPTPFVYLAQSITAVTPSVGVTTGGASIRITGTNLSGATKVKIGGIPATNVVTVDVNTVTAVTPAGSVGAKSVEVENPIGTAVATAAFTYVTPPSVPTWATPLESLPDPSVVTNASMRAAIIATGKAWRVRDTATQIEMLLVPPGTFDMGCSESNSVVCASDESPVHQVELTNSFYMGRYEVTQAQWTAQMGSNPSQFQGATYPDAASRPVESVTWAMVQDFLLATAMQLPTEAEWEYAYRAGSTTAYHSGPGFLDGTNDDTLVPQIAWCPSNATSQTHVVGGKAANALGLHDMAGNVYELVGDWYGAYLAAAETNPTGPATGTMHLRRGGAYSSSGPRSSLRAQTSGAANANGGFRVVRRAPVISSVSPIHGSTLGGSLITLTGFNLSGTTAVTVGGVVCTNVQVVSATEVTAVTPAGAVGAAAITLVSPNGTATAPTPFTYVLQSITAVTPNYGLTTGGTAITITGTYLGGATSVKIGGVAATSVVAVDANTVTAVAPAGTLGLRAVEVTTPKGTVSATNAFTYVGPPMVPMGATQLEALPDPAVVTNASMRAAIIATGLPWRVRDTATQIEMLLVPSGTFDMGCSASNGVACHSYESPVHAVTLTNAFYIGRYEVTQAQWTAAMGSNPSQFQGASYPDAATRPVEKVSRNSVQGFLTATSMRLPTEAEWEYACRAGTTTAFHSGPGFPNGTDDDNLIGEIAWHSGNAAAQTHVVGGKAANALGLHDMLGNVREWVSDWHSTYSSNAQTNPTGPETGTNGIMRGGPWGSASGQLRTSYRYVNTPDYATVSNGFRVVRSAPTIAPEWATLVEPMPDPSVVTNASLRAAIIATGKAWRVRDTATQIEMLLVPPGTFDMGCSESNSVVCASDESPVHQVELTNSFYMGRYEVTQAQWTAQMGSNPSQFQGATYPDAASRPVERVTWTMIESFLVDSGMGLPTEAQWEYAYRAGSTTAYHSGPGFLDGTNDDTLVPQIAWCPSNANSQTHVVGGKAANALGLHDMAGNVYEVVADWYSLYDTAAATNPTGPATGTMHLRRGGAYSTSGPRSSLRVQTSGAANANGGFRVVRSIPIVNAMTPQHGSTLGGTPITLSGLNFAGTTAVKVGGVLCTNLQVVSPSVVTADTPAGAAGDAVVTLESPNGMATAPTPFTYVLQSITAVTPNYGLTTGGTAITITGTYLGGATSVKIGGVAATSVVAVDANTVTAVAPAGTLGLRAVEVTTPKGTVVASNAFEYLYPPQIPVWATQLEALPDPALVTNASMRAAIIATGKAWRVRDTATQIEMLLVPPGEFQMGCSQSDGFNCSTDEYPAHGVNLTNAFYLGRYEVTQAQWSARMGSNPSYHQGASFPNATVRPVERVSWTTVQGFLTATGMRLPTEAEWEYSYRAGTATAFHSGPGFPNGTNNDSLVPSIAWYLGNSGNQTHVIGSRASNGLGICDMAGNVREWVKDWDGAYSSFLATNPTGPATGANRVIRGGYFGELQNNLRSSYRFGNAPNTLDDFTGFRVAKNPI